MCNRYGAHKPIGFPAPFASIHVYFVYISSKACMPVRSLNIWWYLYLCSTCLCANRHHTCMQGCMHACASACMHGCIHSSIWIHVPLQVCYLPWRMSVQFILMYFISFVLSLTCTTVVRRCTFHWLISCELLQEQRVINGLMVRHLIVIACISYGDVFAMSVPEHIGVAPF